MEEKIWDIFTYTCSECVHFDKKNYFCGFLKRNVPDITFPPCIK